MSKPRFITLGELCDLLGIGKQTYYKLQRQGYFPEPIRSPNGRPFFSAELIDECQTIVRTRCGKNGLPLTLNGKPGAAAAPKKKSLLSMTTCWPHWHQAITYLTRHSGLADAELQLITGHARRETLAIYQHVALDGDLEAKYQQAMKDADL